MYRKQQILAFDLAQNVELQSGSILAKNKNIPSKKLPVMRAKIGKTLRSV